MNLSNFTNLIKKYKYIIIPIIILLALGAGHIIGSNLMNSQSSTLVQSPDHISTNTSGGTLSLLPLDTDSTGVGVSSSLLLAMPSSSELTSDDIKSRINITPAIDFEVTQQTDGFMLKPKSKFIPNKVYSVKLSLPEKNIDESWAFQTRRDFRVVGTLPRPRATKVPINTGIEVTLSHQDIKGFEENFKIEPQVKGRLEYHKTVAVFVPESLQYDTIYTVTVGKGITVNGSKQQLSDDYTFQFQTQSKNEAQERQSYLSFGEVCYNQPSDTAPYLEFSISRDMEQEEIDVTIYKYKDEDSFIKDYKAQYSKNSWADTAVDKLKSIDLKNLDTSYTFRTKPISAEEPYYNTYLPFPKALEEGYYLIAAKSNGIEVRTLLQINDMQVYMTADKRSSLIWINDMINAKAIADASVVLDSQSLGDTDGSGLLITNKKIFGDNSDGTRTIKIARPNHPNFIGILTSYQNDYYSFYNVDNNYDKSTWNYMYIDRSTYQPNDKVNIWGAVKPRNGDGPPQSITLNLYVNEYSENANSATKNILDTKDVSVDKWGTYMGTFDIKNLPSQTYIIEAIIGEKIISQQYFSVYQYKKPQYILKLSPNIRSYFQDESTDIDVGCEFFEGTPVAGVSLSYSLGRADEKSLTLNNAGKGKITSTINHISSSWQPQYVSVQARSNNLEETELYNEDYVWVFPRDVAVDLKPSIMKDKVSLTINTNKIELSKVRSSDYIYDDNGEPLFMGAPIDREIEFTLYEKYWEPKENGQYYDFINKKTVKKYTYNEVNTAVKTFVVKTTDGKAIYDFIIPNYSKDRTYYIKYNTTDSKNRMIDDIYYLYSSYFYDYGENYSLNTDKYQYEQDEKIEMSLNKGNESIDEVSKGSILYLTLQDGIIECWVSTKGQQTKTFRSDYIPNVYLKAIYFDGKSLIQPYDRVISFNHKQKLLSLDVKTDQKSYKPGDTVTANIVAKDINGSPVKAQVNLSVVDEAYFAAYEQYVDTAGELYRSIFDNGLISTFIGYKSPYYTMGGGAEGAEGGDEGGKYRYNFVDSAYFGSVETDAQGRAVTTFKLPDNLTSWRLTYQGITEDLKVGNGKININAKLPFFVRVIANDRFLAGDSPVVLLSGYGTELNPNDKVKYDIILTDNKGASTNLSAEGIGKEQTELKLPKLNTGIYTLRIKGSAGALSDNLQEVLDVRDSLISAPKTTIIGLKKGAGIGDLKSAYADVLFFNRAAADYYQSLISLDSWGTRLDQVLSRKVSGELWKKYFNSDWMYDSDSIDLSPYQMEDGGLALLTYGSSDAELSAKAATLSSSSFDRYRLTNYFSDVINETESTPLQVCASYLGMAALGEPVLLDVQKRIKDVNITIEERLYLALALAEMGDNNGAKAVFSQVTQSYSKTMEPYKYIDMNGNKDDILSLTSKVAVLGYKINVPDGQKYLSYVLNNSTDDILLNFEKLMILEIGLPNTAINGSVTLNIDGKQEKYELKGNTSVKRFLSSQQVKNMKVDDINGDIVAAVTQEVPVIDTSAETSQVANIYREYNGNGGTRITLSKSGIVEITLKVDFDATAPAGYYTLTDTLPAGLHYVEPEEVYYIPYYAAAEGQLVRISVYHKGGERSTTLKYNARASTMGQFTADTAIIRHDESSACGFANRTYITIE